MASIMFIQFSTSYLCKAGFSDLVTIKMKSRNCLDACNDICQAQSKTEPNIKASSNEDKNKLYTYCVNKTGCDV